METKKLMLVDAYAMIFRAFYAMFRNPRITTTGLDASAVFGFVNTLQDLLKRERPTHMAVCFDPGGKTFRHEAFKEYKANRSETPEGILVAVPYIKRILEAYHIPVYQVEGYEADDVIGTLAHRAQNEGFFTYMVTGDKDFGQLVTPQVKIFNPSKGEIQGVEEVKEKYGIESPLQVIDILALMGDSADNIPGCPGVGPKTAEKLIQQYHSVENLLEHTDELKGALKQRIIDNAEQIKFSKFLATIVTDAPLDLDLEDTRRRAADMDALRQVFGELEFRTLTTRIIDHGEANIGLADAPAPSPAPAAPAAPVAAPAAPAGGQLSLFDLSEPEALAAVPAQPAFTCDHSGYRLITDFDAAAAEVAQLLKSSEIAVALISEGEEAMRATWVGLAACAHAGKAVYFHFDAMGWMLQAVAPLFAGQARIIANDVKRIMVMLYAAKLPFTAPYYDTSVAHYLLQPERGHSTAEIAIELLGYSVATAESYLGPKGRGQLKLHQVSPQRLTTVAGELADVTLALPAALDARIEQEGITHLLRDVEMPLVEVLASMEMAGARIDVKALNDYSITLTEQMNTLERECWELAGCEFNTASPAQVGEILFDHLKLDAKAKKTKTGQYSTTEDVLLKLRDRHPLIDKILELRGIRKLLSTYVNALPQLINPATGRIHTTYNQTVTATGRLSSTNPNLQNIPVRNDEGREIRRAFIPADGNVFFSADYSQIELRLVADLSKDATMLEAFAEGQDIHAITAAKIYHEPLENVTADQRRKAKTANFGILYGISAFGLAERLNIPRAEAKMLIDGYFATFPQVRDYIDRSVAQARTQGYVTTLMGRRRMLPDINSRNAVVRAFNERNAVNAPIQGTAADVIKVAMIAIHRRMQQAGLRSRMILQVHDELNFDVVPSELPQVQDIVITEMENAYHGGVRLTASHGTATNWLDAH
ncbi:MAG: DNA polymerase I [Muribaculaceae bacterium]|nr:DNA polymerase I [Muribaculaceae bacterium]